MARLVFIDDDRTEIEDLRNILGNEYDFHAIKWPSERPIEEVLGTAPDIIVLDLYLPQPEGPERTEIPSAERTEQERLARELAKRLRALYAENRGNHKKLLRDTMGFILDVYSLLGRQVQSLGQSPENGVRLLEGLKERLPHVPIVFYSRKITPEDVTRVLRAGAVDAIRKGAVPPDEVRARLRRALTG